MRWRTRHAEGGVKRSGGWLPQWFTQHVCCVLCGSVMSDFCSPPGSSVHGDSPGKNTIVHCHSLFQGIFPTQGSNSGLPQCRRILYHLSHQGSPRILQWVACPFSRGFSRPRDWTQVFGIAGGFFTSWASRKVQYCNIKQLDCNKKNN